MVFDSRSCGGGNDSPRVGGVLSSCRPATVPQMNALILTEDSSTTGQPRPDASLAEYYEGSFGSVKGLVDDLPDAFDVTFLIHSSEHGCVKGDDPLSSLDERPDLSEEEAQVQSQEQFVKHLADADFLFVSLTRDDFMAIIPPVWDRATKEAQSGSIWGLAAASSCLGSIDVHGLKENVRDVVTYTRVGVARVNQTSRDRLLRLANDLAEEQPPAEA